MNGGSRIIGLRPATGDELAQDFPAITHTESSYVDAPDQALDTIDPPRFGWAMPVFGGLVSVAWIGTMLGFARDAFPLPPVAFVQFAAALCVVPTLVAVLCLLALRTSRAEAHRFGATARAMRAEAASLERTVAELGSRISANRELLAEQAQILTRIGDATSDRVQSLGAQITTEAKLLENLCATIIDASNNAERSLANVFDALPKAHSQWTGMAQSINSVALNAATHAASLDTQLSALAERGRSAEDIASGAAARLSAHVQRTEVATEAAASRLDSATAHMGESVDAVLDRAAEAIDEARKGIAAQGEAMLAMIAASQAALEKTGRDGAEALQGRLSAVEAVVERISQRLDAERTHSDALFDSLVLNVDGAAEQLDRLHAAGLAKSQALAASISALSSSTEAMTESMRVGDVTARALIGTTEELLVALDLSARELDETLPDAIARLDRRIVETRQLVGAAKPELLALVTAAESTHVAVEAVNALVTTEREKLAEITATLTEALDIGQDKALTMDSVVGDAIAKTRRFAEDAAPQLVDALSRIRETADRAADSARTVLTDVIPDAATAIETASADAVRRAFARALPQPLAELRDASETAVEAAVQASERLSQQLMTIAESTATIEARIDAERAEREANNQDNFARRVSLLIEALNSASIDITKAFSHEVSDSAWSAYLKGDRGVFTRRAVRLLDAGEAREIARLHAEDPDFREHVNRYIHDFEAMLRQILTQRDGSPMGVTLLSSDMGKLYVSLAQAIERLRA
ncbi:hypothetical protein ACFSC3_06770 [Sphingomonas floccifaciens]|uniref:ATPase n=1 Tax=Sphingomonas floccifaciens TaxID=1844115 RepID=A0ABW4NCM4_9SPHN